MRGWHGTHQTRRRRTSHVSPVSPQFAPAPWLHLDLLLNLKSTPASNGELKVFSISCVGEACHPLKEERSSPWTVWNPLTVANPLPPSLRICLSAATVRVEAQRSDRGHTGIGVVGTPQPDSQRALRPVATHTAYLASWGVRFAFQNKRYTALWKQAHAPWRQLPPAQIVKVTGL